MSPRIKFGIRIHQRGYSYEALRKIWVVADELGYYSATLYDLLNIPALECWTTLASLAAETQHIRLVSLVLANLYRHPALLAKMASTLDVISRGRLELGIGAGGDEADHLALGFPFPPTPVRVDMLIEAIQIIKQLWTGARVSFAGRYYQINQALCDPTPVQKPHPPLLIGGHGETHLLRAVAMHADICNMRFDMSLDKHREKRQILETHCQSRGRSISEVEISHNARVFIAENEAALEAMLSQDASRRGMSLNSYRASLGNAIVGTPEQCISQIKQYVNAGIAYFFLVFPHPIALDSVRLFAAAVMSSF